MGLSTSWPSVTGDRLNFNAKQFINDVAAAAGDDNWDGWVRNEEVVIPEYPLDPSLFANSGDQRHSLGKALKSAYDEFLPRINAYTEVVEAGGCQIINEYICDSDGNPIIKASPNCMQVANTVTAQTNNGAINVNILKPQEVVDFVNKDYQNSVKLQADSFINYIKTNYINQNWFVKLCDMKEINTFYVQATAANKDYVYLKYYYDQKDNIAKGLNLELNVLQFDNDIVSRGDMNNFMLSIKQQPLIFDV